MADESEARWRQYREEREKFDKWVANIPAGTADERTQRQIDSEVEKFRARRESLDELDERRDRSR